MIATTVTHLQSLVARVCRIGRTARFHRTGDAVLMLLPSETPYVERLRARGLRVERMAAGRLLSALPVEALSPFGSDKARIVNSNIEDSAVHPNRVA